MQGTRLLCNIQIGQQTISRQLTMFLCVLNCCDVKLTCVKLPCEKWFNDYKGKVTTARDFLFPFPLIFDNWYIAVTYRI